MQNWIEKYGDGKIILPKVTNSSWVTFFNRNDIKKLLVEINKQLSEVNKREIMLPLPDLVFNALNLTRLDNIKVVILGQDPYFTVQRSKNKEDIILATGSAFSVPPNAKIPSSLGNIFNNLIKFKHIKEFPESGNLEKWQTQGCLLLNTSLTVLEGKDNANCHQYIWSKFTDLLIKHISDNRNELVFLLWGAHAFSKSNLIDESRHKISVSSHPSGQSYSTTTSKFKAFRDVDHFGIANEYLTASNKIPINWQL